MICNAVTPFVDGSPTTAVSFPASWPIFHVATSTTAGAATAFVPPKSVRMLASALATSGNGPMFFVKLPWPYLSSVCAFPVSCSSQRISAGVSTRPRIARAADWIATTADVTTGEADEVPL